MMLDQALRVAIVGILDTDAGVQSVTGRSSGPQVVEVGQWLYHDPPLPLLVYDLVTLDDDGASARLALSAVASGAAAASVTRSLIDAADAALNHTAFAARGIDISRLGISRRSAVLGDSDRLLTREGDPELYQSDADLDLTIFPEEG